MTDFNLKTQEVINHIEDTDETWALKLLNECEQEINTNYIGDQEIYVEKMPPSNIPQTAQLVFSVEEDKVAVDINSDSTAIERQIRLKAEQAKLEPSNKGKKVQGFWSFLRRSKAVN